MRGRPAALLLAITTVSLAAAGVAFAQTIPEVSAPTAPVIAMAAPHVSVAPSTGPRDTGCVIVKYRKIPSASAERALGLEDAKPLAGAGTVMKAAPRGMTATAYAKQLERSALVEYAEPDYLLSPAYTSEPDDPDFQDETTYGWRTASNAIDSLPHAKSWPLRDAYSSHFDEVWPVLAHAKADGSAVHVAVMDSGFYFSQSDLLRNGSANIHAAINECNTYYVATGRCTTDSVVEPVPDWTSGTNLATSSHGTMTASEIGQAADNGVRSTGAGYDTCVDVYKVMGIAAGSNGNIHDGDAVMPDSALVNGIRDAVDASLAGHYRLVISISLEMIGAPPAALRDAIEYADDKGVVVVAAAGNSDRSTVSYPAAYPTVVAVGSDMTYRDSRGTNHVVRSSFSNYGTALDLMAPGENIWGPLKPGAVLDWSDPVPGYSWWSGTSMSAPYVASAAALLLRVEPTLTPAEVESYLKRGAVDMGTAGWDRYHGWGRLDAYGSYLLLATPVTTISDLKPRYALTAALDFSVKDRDSGDGSGDTTYYQLDGGATHSGTVATAMGIGLHMVKYRSIDQNGVAEATHTATFEIKEPDTTPPTTSCDATGTHAGSEAIHLHAADAPGGWGLAHTYYRIDGGATKSGASFAYGAIGPHTIEWWSVDLADNQEATQSAGFTITRARAAASLKRSASSVRHGSRITFSGALTPAMKGDVVRIQYRKAGSTTWHYFTKYSKRTVTSVTSKGRGTWSSLRTTLKARGLYYFRVVFAVDDVRISRTPATSKTVSVRVR